MKSQRLSVALLAVVFCVMASSGCTRALRDGVSIGVTDGLSDGIATLVTDFIGSFSGAGDEE